MGNSLNITSSNLTMSSREIADLTGKEHRNVMADIRKMLAELHGEDGVLGFQQSYINEQNKEQPCFSLPKRESLILVSGYNVQMRATIIDRWQALEAQAQAPALNPANWSRMQLIELAMQAEQERLVLAEKIEEMKPKANGYDLIAGTDGSLCITDAAKELQIKPKQLISWLSCNEWIYKRAGGTNWIGYQDKIQQNLVEMKAAIYQNSAGDDCQRPQVRITGKGLAKLAKQFAADITGE